MKAFLALLLALALGLTGCGGGKPQPEAQQTQPSAPLEEIIQRLAGQFETDLPTELDSWLLEELLSLEEEDVQEYAGQISMSMVSADNLIAIRATPKNQEKVQKALSRRLEFVRQAFAEFLPEEYEKARAGSVTLWGDCVFLVVAGRPDADPAEEAALAQEIISSFFEDGKSDIPGNVS